MALKIQKGYIAAGLILALSGPAAPLRCEEPAPVLTPQVREVSFTQNDNVEISLDLYLPALESETPRPVCLYIHGGGWLAGDKSEGSCFLNGPVSAGWIGVSASYRLSGEALWPAQIEDVRACLEWITANASELNADPERIIVAGGSAGGQLALMAGLEQRAWGDYRIIGICSLYGPTDLQAKQWIDHQIRYMLTALLGRDPALDPQRAGSASPLRFVDAEDPAVLLVHGDADEVVPYEQSTALLKRLRHFSVPARLISIPGGGHGNFDETEPDWGQIASEFLAWSNALAGMDEPAAASDNGQAKTAE